MSETAGVIPVKWNQSHPSKILSKSKSAASAVEIDSEGRFVWVVKDGVVGRSYVTVEGYQEQGVVISSGLEPGDKVIVKGAAKVSTGMKVKSVEQAY